MNTRTKLNQGLLVQHVESLTRKPAFVADPRFWVETLPWVFLQSAQEGRRQMILGCPLPSVIERFPVLGLRRRGIQMCSLE